MRNMVNVKSPQTSHQYRAPEARYGRSQVSRAHTHKTSFDAGDLVPYLVEEVLPGDTYTCKATLFGRVFSPLNAPIMDDIEWSIDYFFVPNRLVWDNWEYFLGAHDAAGAQDTTYTIPIVATGTSITKDTLASYMGIPVGLSTTNEDVSCLPFRAYCLIYDEWYRDQNIIDSISPATDNGPDSDADSEWDSALLKSAKKADYFTTCLPYLQKGTAQVGGLTGSIDVQTDASAGTDITVYATAHSERRELDTDSTNADVSANTGVVGTRLYVDLADATGFSINSLREAAAVQRLLERDARGGTRHPELIRAHFGVDVPDYRTQRPEYLGGGTGFINTSPVANTSSTATENQGELAGTAAGVLTASWAKSFVEHGFIIGILRARGQVTYQQGLDRMWSRSDRYDFLWPELCSMGEQSVLSKELYITGGSQDDDVFGYQERYAEYRWKKSLITGQFLSSDAASLDFWHLSEEFGGQQSLNQTFIEDATPMARVTVVDTQHDFIVDGRTDLRVARVMPVRSVPSLMPARF